MGTRYYKGYASEVLRRVIEYLIKEQGFYLVTANHRSSNPASGRVMQKIGMKHEGTLRKYDRNWSGELVDAEIYSIIKGEERE